MRILLDARRMQSRKEAHTYLKEKLQFPECYGNNLDALYDCLTELQDVEIVVENGEEAEAYYSKVKRVLKEAAERNSKLRVEL